MRRPARRAPRVGRAPRGEPARIEEYYPGLGGWFDVQVYPNEDGGLAFYFEEISERKERKEALREAKEKAEEAQRMQSAFLANMSHEIRTPLTSIIGFAETVGTEVVGLELPDESPLPKYAGLIEKSGQRLLQTPEGVLNLSKLEAGRMGFSSEPVGPAGRARRTVEELRPEAQEKNIDLRLQAEATEAEADEGGVHWGAGHARPDRRSGARLS